MGEKQSDGNGGTVEDLGGGEAIAKMQALAKDQIAMVGTRTREGHESRPLATQTIDADGTVWFMIPADSPTVSEVAADPAVDLTYAVSSKSAYLHVRGRGQTVRDPAKAKELWSPIAKAWFDGPEDPNLALLKVTPTHGRYWDTTHGKLVSTALILTSIVTGATLDGGRKGDLEL
jgi:general stress protein 26